MSCNRLVPPRTCFPVRRRRGPGRIARGTPGHRERIRQDGRIPSSECPDCRTRTVFSVNPKALQSVPLQCWCDTAGHEANFVAARRERPPLAIECTWSAADLSTENLRAFRSRYPIGENIVVAQDADRSVTRSFGASG